MPYAEYTTEEVGRRGQALYEQQIRDKVEAEHRGKFLVLDITTGAYEIAEDDLAASDRLLAKHPSAVSYGLRIGYPAAYRLGVGHTVVTPSEVTRPPPEAASNASTVGVSKRIAAVVRPVGDSFRTYAVGALCGIVRA